MDVSKIAMPLPVEPVSQVRPVAQQPSAQTGGPTPQPSAPSVSSEELEQTMSDLAVHYNLKFELSRDEETGSEVVRIFSRDGQRLLRQLPPEAVLKIAEDLDRGGNGGLLAFLA